MQRKRTRGVTLVEVLIVVAILAIIAGAVAVFAIPHFMGAQQQTARTDTRTLVSVVETYRLSRADQTACPTVEELKANNALRKEQNINDPWGHPYKITCDGLQVGVTSTVPDGKPNTDDDIGTGAASKP
jgi:general secretion pathway protein G